MSEKNTNEMKISNYIVGVGGNLRKTTVAIMKTEFMRYDQDGAPRNEVAVFVTDNHHRELSAVHGTKTKGKVVPIESDNPRTGVAFFDLRRNNEEIINNIQEFEDVDLIQDNPADSVDYQDASGKIEKFVKQHKKMNRKLIYSMPLVDKKSLSSVSAIYEMFAGKEISNVLFEFIIFEGTMKDEDSYDEFTEAYAKNKYVNALLATGQVKVHAIESVIDKEIGEAYVKKMRFHEIEAENKAKRLKLFDFSAIEDMYEEYGSQFLAWLPEARKPATQEVILPIVE